jgi:hypothetical protein
MNCPTHGCSAPLAAHCGFLVARPRKLADKWKRVSARGRRFKRHAAALSARQTRQPVLPSSERTAIATIGRVTSPSARAAGF